LSTAKILNFDDLNFLVFQLSTEAVEKFFYFPHVIVDELKMSILICRVARGF